MDESSKQTTMIKQTLFTGWHFMRLFRLALGLFIAVQAIQTHDALSGFISAFFLYQAVFNVGCCGTSSCAVPLSKENKNEESKVELEEIKINKYH